MMDLALHLNLGQDRLSHSCSELVFFPLLFLSRFMDLRPHRKSYLKAQ